MPCGSTSDLANGSWDIEKMGVSLLFHVIKRKWARRLEALITVETE